ncbi:hypothetical protein Tco_0322238 [Tanacetum coccineum]
MIVLKLVKKGRRIQNIDDNPLVSLVRESVKEKSTDFVTPTKASGEVQEEEISPTILEAAKTLSKVASQGVSKEKSTDKGKRYRRRERSMAKKIDTGLDAKEEINIGREEINTGIEEVSTGSTKVDSGTASKKGQRGGKAPMVEEDIQATYKTKEQVRQKEAGLEEAIKLQAQLDEEVSKQIHLDKMIAKRMAKEEALTEQQKKRKAQVQFEAQFYTEEDWDAIRAKLEANAELSKDVFGQDLLKQDFAKRMAEMVNQRKKHFAEERAKGKRNKPMTQSQLRIYMSNYLKNQGTWKLSQLKKLKFKEIKEEFDKYGEELQTKTSKKQRFDDKDVPIIGEKVAEVKEEEPVKRTGKRKKQKGRKGIKVDKILQEDSETNKEESVEAMNPTPLTTKSDSVVNWKIFQQGQRSIYQIMRANGADTVYMSFGAMVKDFTREDLIELYRLVMQKYGTNRPEDAYDRVLWSDLRTMFDPPLNEDAIWSLPLQQKMVSWSCEEKAKTKRQNLSKATNPLQAKELLQIKEMADQDTPPPTITAMKIPIIKKGEYDIWSMRMRQYICHTDHNLWDIIVNGDLEDEATPSGEQSSPPVPKTAKQLAARRNQERIKSILLLAIPDEYLLKFHNVPDAKSLWAAIKSRFGGNEESKKMQKNVLKHQFKIFVTPSNETLDKAYDRFQKLISQLEIHGAYVSKEDINQKFLRSLPPLWSQIALIMRNKPDIDEE